MEEVEYKLSQNNPVVILNAITKLVETVLKAHSSENMIQINELSELKLLKRKCEDHNILVSHSACQGIVKLVDNDVLKVLPTLCELVASLPSVNNYNSIIHSISDLLVIEMKRHLCSGRKYQCQFSLQSPLHPFVTLLNHDKNIWFDVLNQMEIISNHQSEEISGYSVQLLRPVFLYILCDPTVNLPPDCRQRTWCLLLQQATHSDDAKELLLDVLSWLQEESDDALLLTSCLYYKLAQSAVENKNVALCMAVSPCLASFAHSLMHRGHDPRPSLSILTQLLKLGSHANSCVLMLLADSIESCPAMYLADFLHSCLCIIENGTYNVMSGQMLICATLQWLISPSFLVAEELDLAHKILALVKTTENSQSCISYLCKNEWFCRLQFTDERINLMTELCKLSETWEANPGIIINGQWFERVKSPPPETMKRFRLFLSALFLYNFNLEDIKSTSLNALLMLAEHSSDLCNRLLPVLLYVLTQEQAPPMQVKLLRGITAMAAQKENIALVLSTLGTLKQEPSLKCLTIDLHLRLWKVESRCYPYLQALLLETSNSNDWDNFKILITKAAAIKEICSLRPEQYGTELVSLLSQMLNQCVDEPRSLAASLALQSIAALCKVDVVDITTTWKVLAPKLIREKRRNVIISTCEFMSIIPSAYGSGTEYEIVVAEAVGRLWNYVSSNNNVRIITSALTALSKFSLDHLSLKTLPENYRRKLSLPREYSKTPVDAARKPEDVLPYIPGECWIQFLKNVHVDARDVAGDLLTQWIEVEIKAYRSLHSIDKAEPINCSHLPHRSVYRSVADHLRVSAQKPTDVENDPVVLQCLRILSHSYSKPLPPFNWSFLQEFFKIGCDLKKYCLILVSKQAISSGSARKLIDGYITAFVPSEQTDEDILEIFALLGDLCKGVPPNILRPLIERSITWALEKENSSCETSSCLLESLIDCIKSTLQKDNIHDANRALLAMQVESLMEKLTSDHHVFPTYVSCTLELPMSHQERMTSPSLWWDIEDEKLRCATSIRTALACRGDAELPLVWLNECIDAGASRKQLHCYLLRHIQTVMVSCRGHKANWQWILELLGKIQSVISGKADADYLQTIEFTCNIFLLTVIVLAGYECLTSGDDSVATSLEVRLQLFPQALATLLTSQSEDVSPQVMEWLHHMQSCKVVPTALNVTFRQGLMTLRHKAHFYKSSNVRRFLEK